MALAESPDFIRRTLSQHCYVIAKCDSEENKLIYKIMAADGQ